MSQVNAEVVQAALSNILDGLMDRETMPAVRLSNAKTRVERLMNAIDVFIPDRENGRSYPTPPCATCGEPVYLTVSGPWRHVERDYAHDATPDREVGSPDADQ